MTTEPQGKHLALVSNDTATNGEVHDAEVIEQLSESAAKKLDHQIDTAIGAENDRQTKASDRICALLTKAVDGQIHKALPEYPSALAYIKAKAERFSPTDSDERDRLIRSLSRESFSQRAIAGALIVGVATVNRALNSGAPVPSGTPGDEAEAETSEPSKSKGLDGKEYPRSSKPKPKISVTPPTPKQTSIMRDFETEIFNLQNCVSELQELLQDDRFPQARSKIKNAHTDHLIDAYNSIMAIVGVLAGPSETD